MKRILTLCCTLLVAAIGLQAQTMDSLLRAMPDSILPLLTRNDRLDMLDYAAAKQDAELTNRLGGKSQMVTLTDTYALIRLTETSDVQLKLLLRDGIPTICLVRTRRSQSLADSNVTFYTTDWQPLAPPEGWHVPEGYTEVTLHADTDAVDFHTGTMVLPASPFSK